MDIGIVEYFLLLLLEIQKLDLIMKQKRHKKRLTKA